MNVLVLNGSPKGKFSITVQTVLYLQKLSPDDSFEIVDVGQKIKALEKDFQSVAEKLERADLVMFSYPVYTFLATSQLQRFIELMKEHNVNLKDKFVCQITTSKHFYDNTAQKYVEENCYDFKMKYVCGLSADMDDLLTEKGQKEARDFWKYVKFCIKKNIYHHVEQKAESEKIEYRCQFENVPKKDGFDTVIVTDENDDEALAELIKDFQNVYPHQTRVINIAKMRIDGGCLGCFKCAISENCVYKDGYQDVLRGQINNSDAIVYAFRIKDHSMGARFKMFDDRQFCNGHRMMTIGKPVGYLICGDIESENNLKTVLEARAEVGKNFFCSYATDKTAKTELTHLSDKICYSLENKISLPQNFYGVGGTKVFRDLIYLMRGMMKADHKFYKKIGLYKTFPQKQKLYSLKIMLVGALLSSQKLQKKMGNKMNDGMIAPYKKVIDKIDPPTKQ